MKMNLGAVATSPAPTECAVVKIVQNVGPGISEAAFTLVILMLRLKVMIDLLSLR